MSVGGDLKNCDIWYVLNYEARTRRDIVKRMVWLDSAHQICLGLIFNGFLKCIWKVLFVLAISWAEYFNLD